MLHNKLSRLKPFSGSHCGDPVAMCIAHSRQLNSSATGMERPSIRYHLCSSCLMRTRLTSLRTSCLLTPSRA